MQLARRRQTDARYARQYVNVREDPACWECPYCYQNVDTLEFKESTTVRGERWERFSPFRGNAPDVSSCRKGPRGLPDTLSPRVEPLAV